MPETWVRFSKMGLLRGETDEDLDVLADLQREGKWPPDPHLDLLLADYEAWKAAWGQWQLACQEAQWVADVNDTEVVAWPDPPDLPARTWRQCEIVKAILMTVQH